MVIEDHFPTKRIARLPFLPDKNNFIAPGLNRKY